MTYSQNLIKRRAVNRKAKIRGETNPLAGTPVGGDKSKKFKARIARRQERRNKKRTGAAKKNG